MAEIKILLEKQLLTIQNQDIIASGDVNYDTCAFHFSGEWDGFTKTAVFYQDKENTQYMVLGSDNTCTIPAPAMAREGNLYIGVFGINGPKVITSTVGRVYIRQGAISGDTVSTEPSNDVFLAIIAQYQRIAEQIRTYEAAAREFNLLMSEQNAVLEQLNAFDVLEISQRLDAIEDRMATYVNIARQILDREVLIRNVSIKFTAGLCRVENEAITQSSICDVYFDEYSYEAAAKALILPVSYDGYLEISSSEDIGDTLTANIVVRRY